MIDINAAIEALRDHTGPAALSRVSRAQLAVMRGQGVMP